MTSEPLELQPDIPEWHFELPDRRSYVQPRVLRSVRRRLIYMVLLALLVGGLVVFKNPVDAAVLAVLTFGLALGKVLLDASEKYGARWVWHQAGADSRP